MTAKIICFPLQAERRYDTEAVVHDLGQHTQAQRNRIWQRWTKRTKAAMRKRGIPADVAASAISDYKAAVRATAEAMGYVASSRDQDRAS